MANICIHALITPDDTWHKMKAVYDACTKAGISVPTEVRTFFNFKEPSFDGVEIELDECIYFPKKEECRIQLEHLPKHTKAIRIRVES